jgi:hypothetical protein
MAETTEVSRISCVFNIMHLDYLQLVMFIVVYLIVGLVGVWQVLCNWCTVCMSDYLFEECCVKGYETAVLPAPQA